MAIATGVVGIAGAATSFFMAKDKQDKADKFIDEFEWDDTTNPYEDLTASTLGSELRTEVADKNFATSVEALRSSGQRALIGGLGRAQASRDVVQREIASDLDKQQKAIDFKKAEYDTTINAINEKRRFDELSGYGQLASNAQQQKSDAISMAVNTAGYTSQTKWGQGADEKVTDWASGLFEPKSV